MSEPCTCRIRGGHLVERCPEAERLREIDMDAGGCMPPKDDCRPCPFNNRPDA